MNILWIGFWAALWAAFTVIGLAAVALCAVAGAVWHAIAPSHEADRPAPTWEDKDREFVEPVTADDCRDRYCCRESNTEGTENTEATEFLERKI